MNRAARAALCGILVSLFASPGSVAGWPRPRRKRKRDHGAVTEAGHYPLRKGDVLALATLTAKAGDPDFLPELIDSCGISFKPTAVFDNELLQAGASQASVNAVLSAKYVPWPTSEPAGGTVYLTDDQMLSKRLAGDSPPYPESARMLHVQGDIELWIVVAPDGTVKDAKELSRPLGFGIDLGAVTTVSHWRYAPPERDGRPVEVHTLVTVTYRLGV